VLSAVGLVATRIAAPSDSTVVGAGGGRSVLFLDGQAAAAYEGDADRALDVVHGPLTPDHVLASSAIPVAFPPIQLSEPEQSAGWYVDGGIRLNTPLHPAVALGATKIVLIAATATTYGPPPPPDLSGRTPDIADAAAQVMHAALADRTSEDLTALLRTNRLVGQAADAGAHHALTGTDGHAYRQIDVPAVAPPPGAQDRGGGDVPRLAALARCRRVRREGRTVPRHDEHRGEREHPGAARVQRLGIGAPRILGRPLREPPQVGAGHQTLGGLDECRDVLWSVPRGLDQPHVLRDLAVLGGQVVPLVTLVDRPHVVEAG